MVSDFQRVYDLCARCGDRSCSNGMSAPFWEYAQTFGSFAYAYSHRIGLWEDAGRLVAVAAYETELGEAYFVLDPAYPCLAEPLIRYAEQALRDEDGQLTLCLSSAHTAMRQAAQQLGYRKRGAYPETIYELANGPLDRRLPSGFRFLDNAGEAIDYVKLDACLHYGFDHEDEPDGDTDFRIHMHVTPHFDPRLPVIVVDERTGAYAGYANAFVESVGGFAYLEPLCTQPAYRKRGLAAAILSEMMRRVRPLGAAYLTGGSSGFYTAIGYTVSHYGEVWAKEPTP